MLLNLHVDAVKHFPTPTDVPAITAAIQQQVENYRYIACSFYLQFFLMLSLWEMLFPSRSRHLNILFGIHSYALFVGNDELTLHISNIHIDLMS